MSMEFFIKASYFVKDQQHYCAGNIELVCSTMLGGEFRNVLMWAF
jgi:hypothetical protein